MKRFIISIICFGTLFGFSQTLTQKLNVFVEQLSNDSNFSTAFIGICIKDLTQNQIIYDYNADKNFIPASIQKLPLTTVALQKLGSNYTFKTYLLSSGTLENGVLKGDIYIVGGGDPTLGSPRFKETSPDVVFATWQRALIQKGIHTVDGNLYIDPHIFDNHPLNETWMWGDIGNYFGAGVKGINWHENMFTITVNPADSISKKGIIKEIYPTLPENFIIKNEVITVKKGAANYIMIYGDSYNKQREIFGYISMGKSNVTAKGALPLPEYVCAMSFKDYLNKQGVSINGLVDYIRTDTLQKPIDTLFIHRSPSLSVIINHIHKTSNNIYAEAVFKLLGKGMNIKASQVIKNSLTQMGITTQNITIADGSGLSRANLISPRAVCEVLSHVYSSSFYPFYLQSLSEAGVSGTLRNILKNKPKGSNIYAKSGTMAGIRGYAGYAIHENGKIYGFTIIINNFTCKSILVRNELEKLLTLLIE